MKTFTKLNLDMYLNKLLIRHTVILSVLAIISTNILAQTQSDLDQIQLTEFQDSEQILDSLYKSILHQYRDETKFINSFIKAQNSWLEFRDRHLDSIFPCDDKRLEYGTVYNFCLSKIATELNNQRIKQLEVWLVGVEEGDVCLGSRKIKSK